MAISGKVIKAESRGYRHVETIDIFNMQARNNVNILDMKVVNEAPKEVRSIFPDEDIEAAAAHQNSVFHPHAPEEEEPAEEMVNIALREIDELKAQLAVLQKDVAEKNTQIAEMKKGFRKEGYERGYQEGIAKGIIDVKRDVEQALEKVNAEALKTFSSLAQDSDVMWQAVQLFIEKALISLVGVSYNKEAVSTLMQRVKALFPDEPKLLFRVSGDMFPVFSAGEAESKVSIVKDQTMPHGAIAVELSDGVADFSIGTQVANIMRWLNGEEHE